MVFAKAAFALAAIDHFVDEQVVVPAALPNLRVHDDRRINPSHAINPRRTGEHIQVIVSQDHVLPPSVLDVTLELDAQGAIIPEAVQAAVDFARLKDEPPSLAQRNNLLHVHIVMHRLSGGGGRRGRKIRSSPVKMLTVRESKYTPVAQMCRGRPATLRQQPTGWAAGSPARCLNFSAPWARS